MPLRRCRLPTTPHFSSFRLQHLLSPIAVGTILQYTHNEGTALITPKVFYHSLVAGLFIIFKQVFSGQGGKITCRLHFSVGLSQRRAPKSPWQLLFMPTVTNYPINRLVSTFLSLLVFYPCRSMHRLDTHPQPCRPPNLGAVPRALSAVAGHHSQANSKGKTCNLSMQHLPPINLITNTFFFLLAC